MYYSSGMSAKAVRVYRTYVNMMNEHIRARQLEDPFKFRFITTLPPSKEGQASGALLTGMMTMTTSLYFSCLWKDGGGRRAPLASLCLSVAT